jgi:TetR/AcrR family transcriptional regulator
MVSSRSPEPADVRAHVLAVATRRFAAHGFDGTSLQDIADEVGVTKPAVLHHFPSKEHLRKAVIEGIVEHWQKTLPALLLAASRSEGRFETVLGELHRFFAEDANRARLVLREALDRPAEMKELLAGPVRPWLAAIAEYIERGRAKGRHYADVDAEAYVLHILQLVIAAVAGSSLLPSALEPAEDARARYDRELARIAKTSLFVPDAPARARPTKTRRKPQR